MYKRFFGLRESPFNINPDPRFLHRTPRIQEALDQLTYGIQNRKGLLLLTGEVGTGKTTLINHLLDWLRQQQTPTAFIFNSHLKPNHLFDFILNDFEISTDFRLVSNMLLVLNQWLLKRFRAGSTPVLIVDEAQGLSLELLEEIRLLLNLETASEKLLQIVLVGQPELEEKLKRPEMRQLRQRIALRCNTAPLTLDETRGYIADRLRIAGATREPIFDSDAVEALHHYSRGIPRVINLLSEHALINAYVEGLNPVPPYMVEDAARDFLMEEFRPFSSHLGTSINIESKLSFIHSEFTSQKAQSSQEEAGHLVGIIGPQETLTPVGFAAADHEPRGGGGMIATAPEEEQETIQKEEGSAASDQNLDSSLSVWDLIPSSPEPSPQRVNHRLALNPSAAQSDCAAELVATMGRLLAAASQPQGPRRETPKAANESSPALTRNLPGKHLGPTVPRTMWSGVSARVLRATRDAIAAAGVLLRQWQLGFRHDWQLTVATLNFPRLKKSIGHWLHQPFSAKAMSSSKNQTI
jgi:type II secretory pathway predicted ATPase ExeA